MAVAFHLVNGLFGGGVKTPKKSHVYIAPFQTQTKFKVTGTPIIRRGQGIIPPNRVGSPTGAPNKTPKFKVISLAPNRGQTPKIKVTGTPTRTISPVLHSTGGHLVNVPINL